MNRPDAHLWLAKCHELMTDWLLRAAKPSAAKTSLRPQAHTKQARREVQEEWYTANSCQKGRDGAHKATNSWQRQMVARRLEKRVKICIMWEAYT